MNAPLLPDITAADVLLAALNLQTALAELTVELIDAAAQPGEPHALGVEDVLLAAAGCARWDDLQAAGDRLAAGAAALHGETAPIAAVLALYGACSSALSALERISDPAVAVGVAEARGHALLVMSLLDGAVLAAAELR